MKYIPAVLSAAVALAAAGPSSATIVPGNICVFNLGYNPATESLNPDQGSIGYVPTSPTSNTVWIGCGLPRHSETLGSNVYFRVCNYNSTINCTFSSISSKGDSTDYEDMITLDTGCTSQPVSTSNLTIYTTGKYSADCNLGDHDFLESIRYDDQ